MAADDNICCASQKSGNKSESLNSEQVGAGDSSESVDWIRPPPEAARSVPADNWAHSQRKVLQQCSGEAYGDADYFLILAEIGGREGGGSTCWLSHANVPTHCSCFSLAGCFL